MTGRTRRGSSGAAPEPTPERRSGANDLSSADDRPDSTEGPDSSADPAAGQPRSTSGDRPTGSGPSDTIAAGDGSPDDHDNTPDTPDTPDSVGGAAGSGADPVDDDGPDDADDAVDVDVARVKPFLVTRKDVLVPFGVPALRFAQVVAQLQTDPGVTVNRVLEPSGLAMQAAAPAALQQVVLADMTEQHGAELDALHPQLLVEQDALVRPLPAPTPVVANLRDPGSFIPFGVTTSWDLLVTGPDGTAVADATVYLYGAGVPAQGRTDANGRVRVSLLNDTDATIQAVFVNPMSGYWSRWIADPQLTSGRTNRIRLRTLEETFGGFPTTQLLGWGQRAMRLDQLDPRFDGSGVRVAVIDSGAAPGHPDLGAITTGRDFTVVPAGTTGWTNDEIAHGSHCCGVITGANNATGIRGFAPAADVRALRIFPGGRFSSILEALDYCIQQQIDVVNMSLGSAATSEAVLQKLAQARQNGVACIVAAGNSGDEVQFPGISPDVLTVAAVGKLGEFPDDSVHARQAPPDGPIDNGYFSAAFTCFGPEVDLCAPGVAVVSSVPPSGFAAWDGTSMAAPHISGLAALVLAHHPDLAGGTGRGSATRVDQLFAILKASATPLSLGDPGRTGAGMPDAVRAVTGTSPGDSERTGSHQSTVEGMFAHVDAAIVTGSLDQLRRQFSISGLLP